MRNFKSKLQNSRGASMIIAMVFMLLCVFVGGSVLTAATANAYRVKHLSDQQLYLDQRSAALLLTDELRNGDGSRLKLTVHDVRKTAGGTESRSLRFILPENRTVTAMQRILYETAILNYLQQKAVVPGSGVSISVENFTYRNVKDDGTTEDVAVNTVAEFWNQYLEEATDITGQAHITGTQTTAGDLADFDANYASGNTYDFTVDFSNDSQLQISMDAYTGVTLLPPVEAADGTVTKTEMCVISWTSPKIVKGAAE